MAPTPDEIMENYAEAVDVLNNYNAQEAAKIGNSQRSIGGLAEVVASPSGQTNGLANYTYNRLIRPSIDSLASALSVAGKSRGLETLLNNDLRAAKNRYEDAKNAYTTAATTPKTTNTNDSDHTEKVYDGGSAAEQQPYTAAGTLIGTGSTGNGIYDFIVADGKGGFNTYSYYGPSREEALSKFYRDHGGGPASSSSESGSNGNGVSGGGGGGGGGGGR